MNQSVKDIYADYQYELLKVGLALKEISAGRATSPELINSLLARAERLEALVDLYAYLLACQIQG